MPKLFGTDGIRGVAGKSPLMAADVSRIGRAAGLVLRSKFPRERLRVIAVRDTRRSGAVLLTQVADGLRSFGVDVYDAGVLATPSVAYLVKAHRFHSGVVISASHNPPEFNGIKFFNGQGCKWADAWETAVESRFFSDDSLTPRLESPHRAGSLLNASGFSEDYAAFLLGTLGDVDDFSNFRIALDCANGANSYLGPRIFRDLDAKLFTTGTSPNGDNINVGCGSQHTQRLARLVKDQKCDVGIAFDGDGDRVIFVDEKGREIDGDFLLALLAKYLKKNHLLKGRKAVITVMANLGLKKALAKMGIESVETPVGDRYVSEAMRKHSCVLGGEQSGHIILGRHLPSGDGLLTALHVMAAMKEEGRSLSEMVRWVQKYPQVLLNVPVREKLPLDQLNGVQAQIDHIEKTLGDDGRVLVRYSGTEPLLRIMLEGPVLKDLNTYAQAIAREVTTAIR